MSDVNSKTTLMITGMHCGGCASSVRSALAAVPGVIAATVSLDEGRAVIEYDSAVCAPEALVAAVQSRAFGAELVA